MSFLDPVWSVARTAPIYHAPAAVSKRRPGAPRRATCMGPSSPIGCRLRRFAMKFRLAVAGILALLICPLPLEAQRAFDEEYDWFAGRLKIKGHHIFPRSTFAVDRGAIQTQKSGFGVGLEYVLENGWGFGLAGYTSGRVSEFDSNSAVVVVLAEANYFLRMRALRLA